MIDLHAHLLPALDDGARTLEQALGVLGRFLEDGVTGVVCTPHVASSQIASGNAETLIEVRDRKLEELRAFAPDEITLYPGFEIMLDEPLPAHAVGDRRLSLAGSRYYLVEFPHSVVGDLVEQVLHRMTATGIVPIVAHPERYAACSRSTVTRWREAGARMQVDAITVTRPTSRGARARALVGAGLADVIAADNHGDARTLKPAVSWMLSRASGVTFPPGTAQRTERWVDVLTTTNPRAVVRDDDLVAPPRAKLEESLIEKVRRNFKELTEQ